MNKKIINNLKLISHLIDEIDSLKDKLKHKKIPNNNKSTLTILKG
ncbi:hypothetical protein [Arcobacter arenosus]|nr:hypothetical protein [Arcobacter arenosus]